MSLGTLLRAIPRSFYSKDLYREVAREWNSSPFVYLALVLVLCWIPLGARLFFSMQIGKKQLAAEVIPQIPSIHIRNGHVSVEGDQPSAIFIGDHGKRRLFAIIDPSGKTKSLDESTALILLTDNRLLYKNNNEQRSYDLSQIKNLDLNQANASRWMNLFFLWFPIVLAPFLLAISYALRLFQAVFYALLGLVYSNASGAGLTFFQTYKLALVSITPAVVLGACFDLRMFGFRMPYTWAVGFVVAVYYIFFAVKAAHPALAEPAAEPV